jgi:hypothetical protein
MSITVMRNSSTLLTLVVAIFSPLAIHAQTTKLDRFVGKDLWEEQLSKKDRWSLGHIVGVTPTGGAFDLQPQPWRIWKTNRQGQTRYVVFLGQRLWSIPGGSSACVQLFDAAAKKMKSWCFQTGWRIDLGGASLEYSGDLGSDLLVVHTAPVINGQNIAKEYFAISEDRLRLVRLENNKGELVQNEYVLPNYEIGIVPGAATSEEWVHLLESKDNVVLLAALTFLGGRHIDGRDRDFAPGQHAGKYAELFQEIQGNPRIRDLVENLSNSDNEWVRQATTLALRGSRERLFQW